MRPSWTWPKVGGPNHDGPSFLSSLRSSRRYRFIALALVIMLVVSLLTVFWESAQRHLELASAPITNMLCSPADKLQKADPTKPLPPLYERFHEYERNLPQHDESLPYPEGKHAKFLNTANHAGLSGYGNVVEEMIVNAHLAYYTKRAWVFDNYTWDRGKNEYSTFGDNIVPSRIPLTALLSGPIAGAPWKDGVGEHVPRAVTPGYFYKVCTKKDTVVLDSKKLEAEFAPKKGIELFKAFADKINSIDARCIEIAPGVQIFIVWMFTEKKEIQSLWPELEKSPILTQWGFSPLIISGYLHNIDHFVPPSFWPDTNPSDITIPIPGLMVIHLRRGDYENHCPWMSYCKSRYMGLNDFDDFPDRLEDPADLPPDFEDQDWRWKNVYQKHCLPEIDQIVERVNKLRMEHQERHPGAAGRITRLYIMSNGKREWLKELKEAMHARSHEKWDGISTSRDLVLTPEQKYVSQNVDIYVATRATIFVGVGFSSLTSDIVTHRKINGVDRMNTRFW